MMSDVVENGSYEPDVMGMFVWYDKLDKHYIHDSMALSPYRRVIERGYLSAFQQDRKLKFKDFELHEVGLFNTKTGVLTSYEKPIVCNPLEVWSEQPFNPDTVVREE